MKVDRSKWDINSAVNTHFLEAEWAPKVEPGYEYLCHILKLALEQAQHGKGNARHASNGEAFLWQPILEITRRVGTGYPLGQAVKKVYESQRLSLEGAEAELLGAINYIAAALIYLQERADKGAGRPVWSDDGKESP